MCCMFVSLKVWLVRSDGRLGIFGGKLLYFGEICCWLGVMRMVLILWFGFFDMVVVSMVMW